MAESDGEHWLTYAELGAVLGCTSAAARARAQRQGWPRRAANTVGGFTRVLVLESLGPDVERTAHERRNTSAGNGVALGNGSALPDGVAHVAALESAIAALTEQLRAANERLASADRRTDELAAALVEAQRRMDHLHTELADARTAATISGGEAAALRTQFALRTDRRP